MYKVNRKGLITKGFDVPEPTVKSGSLSLGLLRQAKNLITEPIRIVPLIGFAFYSWLLFLSNSTPGLNALSLDPATWLEVKNLSLNFWLVLPVVSPNSAPVLHPMLEGVFNIVLAWSALFAGFLIDGKGRKDDTSNAMLPTVMGMQFLTNAVFTLYLVNRTPESDKQSQLQAYYSRPLTIAEKIGESKVLPLLMFAVGVASIVWGVEGRPDFGDLPVRLDSFTQLVRSDRLSFSFLVDLAYYSFFQGWLVEDDIKRRVALGTVGSDNQELNRTLKFVASYVPFFGLVAYLLARPSLPKSESNVSNL